MKPARRHMSHGFLGIPMSEHTTRCWECAIVDTCFFVCVVVLTTMLGWILHGWLGKGCP